MEKKLSKIREYTFFPSIQGPCMKSDHVLDLSFKDPDDKYIKLCRPRCFSQMSSSVVVTKEAIDNI